MKSTTAILGLFPKACGRGSLALLLLGAGLTGASAQYLYLDATSGVSGNTTLADGSLFSPPLNGTTGADNNWEQRTTFGSSGNIFESGGEAVENAPELRTLLSGLTPGATYSVYVHFWDGSGTAPDWNVRAGFTANPGANPIFANPADAADLGATAAVLASSLTYSTAPTTFVEADRTLFAGLLGLGVADGSGQLSVYIDDLPSPIGANNRTWYDGVSYAAVPEPSSLVLAALGLAGLAWRRRRAKA
jgi:hypothetical protein